MAELKVRVPGEPERRIPLHGRTIVLGRSEECDVQIVDKRASKRHVGIEPVATAPGVTTWVAVDFQSSNGTIVGGERILRRALASGDVVHVGEVEIELVGADAAPVATRTNGPTVVLSGALAAPAAAAVPVAVVVAPAAAADGADDASRDGEGPSSADALRARIAGGRAVARGVAFLAAGIAIVVGVELLVGKVAAGRDRRREEAEAYQALITSRDQPWERWQKDYDAFVGDHPASIYLADLDRVATAKKTVDERLRAAGEELMTLHRNAVGRSESEILGRLLELQTRLGDESPLASSIRIALDAAAKRRADAVGREWSVAEADADRAISRGDASAALRRLSGFEASHPLLTDDETQRLGKKRGAVRAAATSLADAAIQRAAEAKDADARRAVLLAALRGLSDTGDGDRIRAALSGVARGSLPTATPTAGAPSKPGTPATPPPTPAALAALQAKVTAAETLARERKWAAAGAAYAALAKDPEVPAGRKEDWAERADDLARVARLVDDLAAAAAGTTPPKVKLAAGTADVLAADAAGVKLRRGQAEATEAWATMPPDEVLSLLATGKESPDRHLALALASADLGDLAAAVRHLVAVAELPSHRDAAFRIMAHRLEGRTSVPDGGYFVFEGALVGKGEYEKRSEQKHLASLLDEAGRIAETLAKDPAFKAIEKLRARRDELDRRRAYALVAIFNEKHWPYPHDEPAVPSRVYQIVTAEVTRRWKSVEEVWNEPLKVNAPKGEALDKAVTRHSDILRELVSKGRDVAVLEKAIEPYALYVGAGALTIRTYFRTQEEKDLLEYNRWVMDVYNPNKTAVASDAERDQVRITNEYRVMMGWQFRVEPGPADLSAIEPKNLLEILDSAHEVESGRAPLRALRIDDRLISSARGHSLDMAKRGFFDHFAPPNPATGEGRTSPFDRMQKAGYTGAGMSENIVGGGDPLGAHLRWLGSSGHHRNIVSDWADMGSGFGGGPWTQNFGVGGGAPTVIPGHEPPPDTTTPTEGGG